MDQFIPNLRKNYKLIAAILINRSILDFKEKQHVISVDNLTSWLNLIELIFDRNIYILL